MKFNFLFSLYLFFHFWNCSWSQSLPANMYPDSNFPFIHGVASGDPTASAVIIWTRIEPNSQNDTLQVVYEMAKDESFQNIVKQGIIQTDYSKDWTVKIDVQGLEPYKQYFFRFKDEQNRYSSVGRTRTAPSDTSSHLRIAIMSCSSIFSGFFNGYRRIAEKQDLDLVVHVGDYIYDFVDPDEQIRVPTPFPIDPKTLEEWRDRHKFYLLDPDLREARRVHPWVTLWDNHDVDFDSVDILAPYQAFWEYLPIRMPENDLKKIYRKISYGNLMEMFVIDVLTYRSLDTLSGNQTSMIGNAQYQWLTTELANSQATWKLIPMQKLMCGWSIQGVPSWIGIGDGNVLDNKNWDGYDADRDRLLSYISQNNIQNVIALSGDSHVTIFGDLSTNPYDSNVYNPATGSGSVAVEMLPTSISRGNFDEMGLGWALPIVEPILNNANPQHVFRELTSHGYGILDIQPNRCIGEVWYNPILSISNNETFGKGFQVRKNANHWDRNPLVTPTPPKDYSMVGREFANSDRANIFAIRAYPVPFTEQLLVEFSTEINEIYEIEIFNLVGSKTNIFYEWKAKEKKSKVELNTDGLTNGIYILVVKQKGGNIIGSTIINK